MLRMIDLMKRVFGCWIPYSVKSINLSMIRIFSYRMKSSCLEQSSIDLRRKHGKKCIFTCWLIVSRWIWDPILNSRRVKNVPIISPTLSIIVLICLRSSSFPTVVRELTIEIFPIIGLGLSTKFDRTRIDVSSMPQWDIYIRTVKSMLNERRIVVRLSIFLVMIAELDHWPIKLKV